MSRPKGSKNAPKAGKTPKPAKRAKSAAPAPAKPEPAERPFVVESQLTPGTYLKSLLKDCSALKAEQKISADEIRDLIKDGKHRKKLHGGVFAWLRKLDGMEAEEASEWWHILEHYVKSSGVIAKIDSVQRLPMGDPPVVEDEEAEQGASEPQSFAENTGADDGTPAETAPPTPNVSRPRFGQRAPAGISGTDLAKAVGDTEH